ncbi:40S ribosomal protein S5-1 [Clonorchis sinensis]|uniref:40S ribosomal protein S5-1 n=1 Tax=Clonorchis sinensis TaxID=79923 RepID=A0A8T1MF91_CLOSI|nr:40S ribosomal protein S5-1 [Clonorchis sinensis]
MTYLDTEPEIRLFGKWSADEVSVSDLSLTDHITVKGKGNPILPHTAGRYQVKRFRKAQCPLIERVCCSLMMHGRNNGKKLKALNILKHTFEIIHLLSGENPIQVLVNAILNSGAREDSTRIGRGGTVRRQAVDVSPLRRVNQAIYLLCTGAREAAFRNVKTIAECLADELLNAAKVSCKLRLTTPLGQFQLLRHQKEGRTGASRQIQSINEFSNIYGLLISSVGYIYLGKPGGRCATNMPEPGVDLYSAPLVESNDPTSGQTWWRLPGLDEGLASRRREGSIFEGLLYEVDSALLFFIMDKPLFGEDCSKIIKTSP